MFDSRLLMLVTAAALAAPAIAADSVAQQKGITITPTVDSQSARKVDLDAVREPIAPGALGLRPQTTRAREGITLPFGLNYSGEAKSIFMPLDQKNEWGVGLNLDVNSSRAVELAPASSPLGLQPKRTPGLMLQKKF